MFATKVIHPEKNEGLATIIAGRRIKLTIIDHSTFFTENIMRVKAFNQMGSTFARDPEIYDLFDDKYIHVNRKGLPISDLFFRYQPISANILQVAGDELAPSGR